MNRADACSQLAASVSGESDDTDTNPDLQSFQSLLRSTMAELSPLLEAGEELSLNVIGEKGIFIRFSQSHAHQSGAVEVSNVTLTLYREGKEASLSLPFTRDSHYKKALSQLQELLSVLPTDPYAVRPSEVSSSDDIQNDRGQNSFAAGSVLSSAEILAATYTLLAKYSSHDLVGLVSAGYQWIGMMTSGGSSHWQIRWSTQLDASVVGGAAALAGSRAMAKVLHMSKEVSCSDELISLWSEEVEAAIEHVQMLESLPLCTETFRGPQRVCLHPLAVSKLLRILAWNGFSAMSLEMGSNPLSALWKKECSLSPLLSVSEETERLGGARFSWLGESRPTRLALIEDGKAKCCLTSARAAKMHGLEPRGATVAESATTLALGQGTIAFEDVLSVLHCGLEIQHLHYCNWSDIRGGRLTGMTRYACYQVKNGKRVARLPELRFDQVLTELFSEQSVLGFGSIPQVVPDTLSYDFRSWSAIETPLMIATNLSIVA